MMANSVKAMTAVPDVCSVDGASRMTQRISRIGGATPDRKDLWIRAIPAQPEAVLATHFEQIDTWLHETIARPDPRLGRTGPVCPFVPAALNAEAIQFSFRYDIGDDGHLREVLEEEMADFESESKPLPRSGVSLESRLVVLPALGPDGWHRLDLVYESLKNTAVAGGLMAGQFHPLCEEGAIHNSGFRVSRSPVALLAIRRMAPHDVLFLHERADWFESYDRRFRSHYERGRIRDPLLRKIHLSGLARHDLPALVPAAG
jgi:hypothetical protein